MLNLIKKHVNSYFEMHNQDSIASEKIVYLNVANGLIDGHCFLFFGETSDFPIVVAKGACSQEGKAIYKREFDNLCELQECGINTERQTTPKPLGIWNEDGMLITLQSALRGTLLKNIPGKDLFSKKKIEITFDLVLNWWQHFQNSYGIRTIMITRERYQDEIIKPLELFQQRFHTNQDVDNFLTRTYHDKRNLIDIELPLMARHGDFWTANIVMQPQGIGVFDWESPLKRELPLFDLFFFFSSLRFPYRGIGGESEHFESFKSVFWGDNYFNKVICNRIQRMCEAFDVPLHVVGDLFLLSLIQTANMKYEGFMLAEGFRKEPNDGQQNNEDANNITQHLSRLEKDTPFACFRKGKFENILYVVQRGLPDFSNS